MKAFLIPAAAFALLSGLAIAEEAKTGIPPLATGGSAAGGAAETTPEPARMTSVNLAAIQKIFDDAKVPATTERPANGLQFVKTVLDGNTMFIAPVDCGESGNQDGDCQTLLMISGSWKTSIQQGKLRDEATTPRFSALLFSEEGEVTLRQVIPMYDGLSTSYLEASIVQFAAEMTQFSKFMASASGKKKDGLAADDVAGASPFGTDAAPKSFSAPVKPAGDLKLKP